MMRIITGRARGIKLETLEGDMTRPTSERAKMAIFSSLQFELEGRRVLDLFAGSGAMGVEALSRMAESCTFVDSYPGAIDIVNKNIAKARFTDKSKVVNSDFKQFLMTTTDKYDIVFVDPPYGAGYVKDVLDLLYERQLLREGAIVVVESSRDAQPTISHSYNFIRQKNYGKVSVCLLEAI